MTSFQINYSTFNDFVDSIKLLANDHKVVKEKCAHLEEENALLRSLLDSERLIVEKLKLDCDEKDQMINKLKLQQEANVEQIEIIRHLESDLLIHQQEKRSLFFLSS